MSSKKSKQSKASEKPKYDSKGWEVKVVESEVRAGHDKIRDCYATEIRFEFTTKYKGKDVPDTLDYFTSAVNFYMEKAIELCLAYNAPEGVAP